MALGYVLWTNVVMSLPFATWRRLGSGRDSHIPLAPLLSIDSCSSSKWKDQLNNKKRVQNLILCPSCGSVQTSFLSYLDFDARANFKLFFSGAIKNWNVIQHTHNEQLEMKTFGDQKWALHHHHIFIALRPCFKINWIHFEKNCTCRNTPTPSLCMNA